MTGIPRTPNDALRAAREATPSPDVPGACMSRAELAEAVNRWCAENGYRPGALDEHRIGRMERGKTRWPNADYRAGFRAVLGRSDWELGFRPAGRSPVRPAGIASEPGWRPATGESGGGPSASRIAASQREWLRVRQAPGVRGRELTELAVWLYPESSRAPGGHVLAAQRWLLDKPVPVESVELRWAPDGLAAPMLPSFDHVLPLTTHGDRYAGYSRAVRDLVRPRLLENRPSYRLLGTDLGTPPALSYGTTTFFEVFDVKQAIAHEFKAAWLAGDRALPSWDDLPLRASIADIFDPTLMLMAPGINTLTIRRDRTGDDHRFVELGVAIMTVAVIDDEVFDRLFTDTVPTNDEGYVVGRDGRTDMPFNRDAIDRLNTRLSASALTLLSLAWRDRALLLFG